MDLVKSLVGVLALPLVAACVLALAAIALRLARFRRAAAASAVAAVALAYGCSIPLVGEALLRPLELHYPPLTTTPSAATVVVLGSSYAPRPGVPVAAALDSAGLVRIVSGIQWAERLGARLVVSGGARAPRRPSAHGYAALASELGIPSERIEVLDDSFDTGDEALAVAALLEARPFVLVTSAYHMPRAVRLMERAGAKPIPAPTDQQLLDDGAFSWWDLVPSSAALRYSEEALHEYIGLAAVAAGLD